MPASAKKPRTTKAPAASKVARSSRVVASGKTKRFLGIPLTRTTVVVAVSLLVVAAAALLTSSQWIRSTNAYTYSAEQCQNKGIIVSRYKNSKHPCVATLQSIMRYAKNIDSKCNTRYIAIDQDFGPVTESKVRCFQGASFKRTGTIGAVGPIGVDGSAGPITFGKLKYVCYQDAYFYGGLNWALCGAANIYHQ